MAFITLNRPKQYNAYTGTELYEICEALHDVAVDDQVAVAVITGAGDRAFCTGGDAGTYATIYPRRPHEFSAWWEYYERMLYMIRTCGKPVIARINVVVAVGGQRSILAARVLGEAAAASGIPFRMSEFHGMAQRGGVVESMVLLSDGNGYCISNGKADVLLGFEPSETIRSAKKCSSRSVVITSTSEHPPFYRCHRTGPVP